MNRWVETESARPEFGAILRYENDPNTIEYYPQPAKVAIPTPVIRRRQDGTTFSYIHRLPYTPDILRLLARDNVLDPLLDEWKTPAGLLGLQEKYPDEIFCQDGTWRYPRREDFFAEIGITYCLRSAQENNPIFIGNIDFLTPYLFGQVAPLRPDVWAAIARLAHRFCPITLEALCAHAIKRNTTWSEYVLAPTPPDSFRVDDVLNAIAHGMLHVDLEHDALANPATVVVCASSSQLRDYIDSRPAPKSVTDLVTFKVRPGTEFSFQGNPVVFVVAGMPTGKVLYSDRTGSLTAWMTQREFERCIWRREITFVSDQMWISEILSKIPYLDEKRIAKANWWMSLIDQCKVGPIETTYSIRTLQRKKKAVREAGESRSEKMKALLDKPPSGGRCQILPQQLALIKEVNKAANNSTDQLDSCSYGQYKKLSEKRGIPAVSDKTFRQRSANLKSVKDREGERAAYNKETPITWYLRREESPHGDYPFQYVHIDHTKVDMLIREVGFGGRIYHLRPQLTIAMDAESRAELSFYLSAHAPSTTSCMMIIRAIVQRYHRLPQYIITDNGKEFHSSAFQRLCDRYDIRLRYRPAHESRFGSVCERLFGTTDSRFFHNLPGNTKALKHVRTVTKSVDPKRADQPSFVQLHEGLEDFFFQDYNNHHHPAHDHTPNEFMERRFLETGVRLSRMQDYDAELYIATCVPVAHGGTREIDPQRGIKVSHLYYWADEFCAASLRFQSVPVRLDVWDPSFVWAQIDGYWVRCVCKLLMQFRRLTEIEMRYAWNQVWLRLRNAPYESFESLLGRVLDEYDYLPATAAVTAASRQVYGPSGLTFADPRFPLMFKDQESDRVAARAQYEIVADSNARSVKDDHIVASPYDVDYDSLPRSRRL
ncbi:hypothetical protein CR51_22810 [Caballeronia megalochromosomata]|nr:hypothetical protein CR51_22810 [Caballeronia megalochromosomata]